MAAYRRVYDSRHLQADCRELGSAAEPYARQSNMGYVLHWRCRDRGLLSSRLCDGRSINITVVTWCVCVCVCVDRIGVVRIFHCRLDSDVLSQNSPEHASSRHPQRHRRASDAVARRCVASARSALPQPLDASPAGRPARPRSRSRSRRGCVDVA